MVTPGSSSGPAPPRRRLAAFSSVEIRHRYPYTARRRGGPPRSGSQSTFSSTSTALLILFFVLILIVLSLLAVAIVFVVLAFIAPLIWMILASVKTSLDITNPAKTFNFVPTLANYVNVIAAQKLFA